MNKKRIIFYYKLFFAGGTEHSILKLIRKLYKNFEIFVAYDEEESTNDVLKEIAEYAEIINLNKIDSIVVDTCIWCSHPRQVPFDEFSKKIIARHYYYWCHMLLFEAYPNLEFRQDLMENMEKFICVKCEVVENYLDIQEIKRKSNEQISLNVNNQKLNIISVSRISKDKRIWKNERIMHYFR